MSGKSVVVPPTGKIPKDLLNNNLEKRERRNGQLIHIIKITKGKYNSVVIYGRTSSLGGGEGQGKKVLIICDNYPSYFFCRSDNMSENTKKYINQLPSCTVSEVKGYPLFGFCNKRDPYSFLKIERTQGNGHINNINKAYLEWMYKSQVYESEFTNFDRFCLDSGFKVGDYVYVSDQCEVKGLARLDKLIEYDHTELSPVTEKEIVSVDFKLFSVSYLNGGFGLEGQLDLCVLENDIISESKPMDLGCIFKVVVTTNPNSDDSKAAVVGSVYVLDIVTSDIKLFTLGTVVDDYPSLGCVVGIRTCSTEVSLLEAAIRHIISFDYVLGWRLYDEKNKHTLQFLLITLEKRFYESSLGSLSSVLTRSVRNLLLKNKDGTIRPPRNSTGKSNVSYFTPKYENIATMSSVGYIDLFLFFKEFHANVKQSMNSSKAYIGPFTYNEQTVLCNLYGFDKMNVSSQEFKSYFQGYGQKHYGLYDTKIRTFLKNLRELVIQKDVIGVTVQRARAHHTDFDLVWTKGQSHIFKMILMKTISDMRNFDTVENPSAEGNYVVCYSDQYEDIRDPSRYTKGGSRRGGVVIEPSYFELNSDIVTVDYASNYINTIIESNLGFSNTVCGNSLNNNFNQISEQRLNRITVGTVDLAFVQYTKSEIQKGKILPFIQLVTRTLEKRNKVKLEIKAGLGNLRELRNKEKAIKHCLVSMTGCISRTKYIFSNLAIGETMRHVARYKFYKAVEVTNNFPIIIRDMVVKVDNREPKVPGKDTYETEVIAGLTDGFDFIIRRRGWGRLEMEEGEHEGKGEIVCGPIEIIQQICNLLNSEVLRVLKRDNYGFKRNYIPNEEDWEGYCEKNFVNDKLSIEYVSSGGVYFNATTKILKRHSGLGGGGQDEIIYKATFNKTLQNSWVERRKFEEFVEYYFSTIDNGGEQLLANKIKSLKNTIWEVTDHRLFKRYVRCSKNREKLMLMGSATTITTQSKTTPPPTSSDVLISILRKESKLEEKDKCEDDYANVQLEQMVPYYFDGNAHPIPLGSMDMSRKHYRANVEEECNKFI